MTGDTESWPLAAFGVAFFWTGRSKDCMGMLQVAKVLNNNIAVVVDARGSDCIAMGRGIAFGCKRGDLIDEDSVERLFTQHVAELSGKLGQLVSSIPEEYFEATRAIVEHAKLRLGRNLDDGVYLALTDHIHFAVKRALAGQALDNRLNYEIGMVYPDEFECAQTAISFIDRTFHVTLPQEEAGFIAMHLVNAEMGGMGIQTATTMAKIIRGALDIVTEYFDIDLDEATIAYYRFMVHLKFFAQRVVMSDMSDAATESRDRQLQIAVMQQYPDAYECAKEIASRTARSYGCPVPEDECLYLALHIERVVHGSPRQHAGRGGDV